MIRGIAVTCTSCGAVKAPHGRSLARGTEAGFCTTHNCTGYNEVPYPGCLFPGETLEHFPWACAYATEEVPDAA